MEIIFLSGACIVHKSKMLLLKQPSTSRHPNLWGPPGGHREGNENLIEIASREVKEETNLNIDIKGLVGSGAKVHKDGRISIITLFYGVPKDVNQLKVDKREVGDYKWVSKKDLEKNQFPLRDPLLKPILIKALNRIFVAADTFKLYFEK